MKVDAYRYAESGGRLPYEIVQLSYIDRFGVRAVLGRDELSYGEIQRMLTSENIITFYRSRTASDNWAKWTNDNPEASELLIEAERLTHATD